jgi:hypothetical protein
VADTFGAITLPAGVPASGEPVTDPALGVLLSFLQAVLNAQLSAAWNAVNPATTPPQLPVRHTYPHNPQERWFGRDKVPALYLFRSSTNPGTQERDGEDFYRSKDRLTLYWVFPPVKQDIHRTRDPILSGIAKALGVALEKGRHPAWVVAGDLADPDAIKLAVATAVIGQTYTAVDFDGASGAEAVYAARPFSITTLPEAGAYNTTDPIEFTGYLADGSEFTDSVLLTDPDGGETISGLWPFATPTTVFIPPQLLATGTVSLGYAASPESYLGSLVKRYAGLSVLSLSGAGKPTVIRVEMKDTDDSRNATQVFPALEFEIQIEEIYQEDLDANYDAFSDAADPGDDFGAASAFIDIRHQDTTSLETFYIE